MTSVHSTNMYYINKVKGNSLKVMIMVTFCLAFTNEVINNTNLAIRQRALYSQQAFDLQDWHGLGCRLYNCYEGSKNIWQWLLYTSNFLHNWPSIKKGCIGCRGGTGCLSKILWIFALFLWIFVWIRILSSKGGDMFNGFNLKLRKKAGLIFCLFWIRVLH